MAIDEAVSRETLKGKPGKHPCPHCSYRAMTAGSLAGHIAMAHPDHPVEPAPNGVKPKRGRVAVDEPALAEERITHLEDVAVAAALRDDQLGEPAGAFTLIPLAALQVAANVRQDLGDLSELADSIREHGVIEPIVVTIVNRGLDDEGYRILAGHRRANAAALAGLTAIPAIVDPRGELGDDNSRRRATQLVENVQRADLNEIDIAKAVATIVAERKDLTHADIARWLGKSRSWVTNVLRLLETAPEVQTAVLEGKISATHARTIAGVDVDLQPRLLESVIDRGISAHETERQAEYFKTQAKQIRDRAAKVEQLAAKVTTNLEKVANPNKASIGLADYGGTGSDLRAALEAMGWKVGDGYSWTKVKDAGECGCEGVWRVEVSYQGAVTVGPACNSNEHEKARRAELDVKWKRDQAKANEERRLEREKIEAAAIRVRDAVGEILAERPPSELARRLIVWGLMVADEEPDEVLVAKYLGGETEGQEEVLYEVDDAAWLLTEAIPANDLDDVVGRLVSGLFGSYMAGPGVKAAVEEWSKTTHPETLELAAAEPPAKGKRLGKEVRLGDPVAIGPDEYVVLSIIHPGQEPGMTERPPSIVELAIKGPVKAVDYRLHRVPLADLTADAKARVWRAAQGALQVTKPASHGEARDAAIIDEARLAALECVGSNHVPGCAHMGGEVPPKPAPETGR